MVPNSVRTKLFKLMREKYKEETKTEVIVNKSDIVNERFPFSVAMCVYGEDNSEWFELALESILKQTVKPKE
ncbi:hypothetical protein RFY98_13155, partial [Acinetobacter baumannii]|nr:hypothetical protein [Acinetobacter baumannii]